MEFPSIAHVWLAAQQRDAEIHFVRADGGAIGAAAYKAAIDERTALVSVPLVSYANGMRPAVREIATYAHSHGARVVVDAYQGAGVVPVDVDALGCDYLFAGSLKYLLGMPGMAFLWTNPKLRHVSDPILTGWFARTAPFAFTPRVLDYASDARKYQTGTPAVVAAFAAAAGIQMINETDQLAVFEHVATLAEKLQAGALDSGYELYSPINADWRGPQVAVVAPDSEMLGEFLKSRRIFGSPRGQAVRLSLHYYNNLEDVERRLEALRDFRRDWPRLKWPTKEE